MIVASIYQPMWEDIADYYLWPTIMAASLVAWILSGRRWNSYAYWVIVALGFMWIAFTVNAEGWRRFLFHGLFPDVTHTEMVLEGGEVAQLAVRVGELDLRWGMHFAAKLMTWTVVLLSLSAPFWRKWLRRKLGLRDN